MKYIIAGTAGHIDHGKTALVRALTGIDADRLEEEKRRGITIDLGFAHMQLTPAVRLGFIDVPGHERFVKNMLAGVGGIDLLLFVIAADESIKPQTREHFEICRLLGIPRGVIALTKADLVDSEILELARLEVEEFVAGSFLEGAPVVPVSSVTGDGLEELCNVLRRLSAETPQKDAGGYFRLPVDRAFSVKGFGTVVTGTLVSGTVRKESEVELYPTGRRLRVRGVQVYGSRSDRAVAGQRTAINLADIEPAEIKRGMALSEPGRFITTTQIDCELELLASAKPLKHRAPVHFHAGSAEIEAEVRLFGGSGSIRPGERRYVRIVLREPALLLPGDRFIVRMFSPVTTIGGGAVIDVTGRRYRRSDDAAARLAAFRRDPAAVLGRESAYGMSPADLVARTGLPAARFAGQDWVFDEQWLRDARKRLIGAVREFHRRNPLLPGIAKQELRGQELPDSPAFVIDRLLAGLNELKVDGEIVRAAGHKLVLKEEEEKARTAIEQAFESAGLATPSVAEVLSKAGVEAGRARTLLQLLIRDKKLVRISEDLILHSSAVSDLRELLAPKKSMRFNVTSFKEWTGVSRKYAIPLLEYLDREHVTRREGDERVVL